MTTYNCTTANFATNWALRAAGDTYILADGSYGSFTIFTATYSPRITIEAENRYGAVFSSVATSGNVNGINFVGINLGNNPDFHDPGAITDFTFEWCKSTGYFRCDYSEDVIVRYHYHYNGTMAFSDTTNCTIEESCLHYMRPDACNCYRSTDFTFLNNVVYDMYAASDAGIDYHPDGIQGLGDTRVTVRGNIIIDDPSTVINPANPRDMQGIFMGTSAHVDIEISQNMVSVGNANGIRLSVATGSSFIQGNSLIGTQLICNATVQASLPVEDNIALAIVDEDGNAKMALSNNLDYSVATDGYVDPTGLDWTKFETVEAHSTKGAATRYAEILAGTNVEAINLAIDVGGISFTAPGEGEPGPVTPTLRVVDDVLQLVTS